MTTGTGLIQAERNRQVTVEGYTDGHDDGETAGELSKAAACYLAFSRGIYLGGARSWWLHPIAGWVERTSAHGNVNEADVIVVPKAWPWPPVSWRPSDPKRCLVKAGALIAAELDRIERASTLRTVS